MSSNYEIEKFTFDKLENQLKVPSYQRPLVWTKSQKQAFIDNISRGFPFGSLLLYKYDGEDKYSLIDGQQRFSTLRDYKKHPEEYYPIDDPESDQISRLLELTGASSQAEEAKEQLRHKFIGAIKVMFSLKARGEAVKPSHLYDELNKICPASANGSVIDIVNMQGELLSSLDDYLNLDDLILPCVIFNGNKSDLPEVFANVNLGGRKLTKYQVFTAQWTDTTVQLSAAERSDAILEKTIDRYEELTKERQGIEIEDFSAEEMRQERKITLPEFCHALGELIMETCPAFWTARTIEQDDAVDTIGYNSLAIVFGIHPQNLSGKNDLPSLADAFKSAGFPQDADATDILVNRIIHEYEEINGRFAIHLKKPGVKTEYETAKSSVQLQFLSFFAALWFDRYGSISDCKFEAKPGYKSHGYDSTCKNIFRCFVLDMLTNRWKGSGDSRLANYIDGKLSYSSDTSFSEGKLESAASAYLDNLKGSESIRVDPVAKTLITILANTHLDQYGASSYDYEHLVSQKTLKKKIEGQPAYKAFKLPGGSIGNIAFLSAAENRAKGSATLPESKGEMFEFNGAREYIEDPDLLRFADFELQKGDPEKAKRFIDERGKTIMQALIKSLCN